MESRNLEKAMELFGALITGEEISKSAGKNVELYEAYENNAEVNAALETMLKSLNIKLYDYKNGLYITAGDHNRVFGYTNEELKRAIGVRLNKELYLCYFIIYNIVTRFYNDSASVTYLEYVRIEDVIRAVDAALSNVISNLNILIKNEVEEHSFKSIALLWDELPIVSKEDTTTSKASRSSQAGFVKLVFNFLISQDLFLEAQERYYPKERFHVLVTHYFEEERGRLFEIMMGEEY